LRRTEGKYGLGIILRYVKTPVSVTDVEFIGKHSSVVRWRDMLKFLVCLS